MKKYINAENITTLAIVIVGVLLANGLAAPVAKWVSKLTARTAAS